MKTLFVTGAEGFTGRHLVKFLRRRGYDVVAGVRNRARKLAFEKQIGRALVCDVSDPIDVARAIGGVKPDGVIHLAGASLPSAAAAEPLNAYQGIVTAWANVLDAVRRIVPRSRVVLVSACEVYGNSGADGVPIREATPPAPISTFGSLKAAAEAIAHTYFLNYHLNLSIARPFHYIGDGQADGFFFASVAKRLVTGGAAIDGQAMELPDLGARRDVMHIQDAVQGYTDVLEEGQPNEIYNIASGQTRTVREIVEAIARHSGRSVRFVESAPSGEPGIACLCGDNTRIREEFGWRSDFTPEQAAQDLVAGLQRQFVSASVA